MKKENGFVSDSDSYERFVGGITPREFVEDFDSIEDAVNHLIEQDWVHEEPAPTWLRASLINYVSSELEETN